jgi:steroid 5-alpha reductase family enzyme
MDILLLILIYISILFMIGTLVNNNAAVDIGWGLGFVLVAWFTYLRDPSVVLGQWIITILVTIWGMRLFYQIAKRSLNGGDALRNEALQRASGKRIGTKTYFQVYGLVGSFLYLISLTIIKTSQSGIEANPLLLMPGILLWFFGFYYEAIGDYALRLFFLNYIKKGELLTNHHWSLRLLPNYIGEATMWWGIFLIAIVSGAPVWTIISPITLTLLLFFISGAQLPIQAAKKEANH